MMKRATQEDVHTIEGILGDAVKWMNQNNIPNLWNETNILWDNLEKSYQISDFYIAYLNEKPVGCVAVTDIDTTYWHNIECGKSLYLHKLAIKNEARGNRLSSQMIDHVKNIARSRGINEIRLDCNADRAKLRKIYEDQGFKLVKEIVNDEGYRLALYKTNI